MEIRELAEAFEAVLVGFSKSASGIVVRLSIHPDDVPSSVATDPLFTRYQVALVRISDNGEPENHKKVQTDRRVARAGMLCRSEIFRSFLSQQQEIPLIDERGAADYLCSHLHIESRKELSTNLRAGKAFDALIREFEEWLKRDQPWP